eukprot:TRINITY_DN1144_c0_g1_i1.p1 TRINITY_DN1144_c0_g1~~TRINITY_DN1144_c0_g1_i1.p1  ORF type:complete len:190 (-),score=76.99 TRINITY_DN1144_c0_g1_i1:205-774(-)
MKIIESKRFLAVPKGVSINIKSRHVTVSGPRGSLERDLKHLKVDLKKIGKQRVEIGVYFGDKKHVAQVRTVESTIKNMIIGVTKGFCYKMRAAYAHFHIGLDTYGNTVEVARFMGEKRARKINLLPGVIAEVSKDVKDELVLTGNDIENVSKSAAMVHQSCMIRHKDIRFFLDGVYVSESGIIGKTVPV